MIIEADPVADDARRVLDTFEAMPVSALLFQGPDYALNHAILLGAVRGNELLPQTIAANQGREVSACEDETIIRPQQELPLDPAERPEASNQSVLKRGSGRGRLARAGQMPAQQLARVTVDHQRQRGPAILAGPDSCQVGRPPLIGRCSDGGHRLDPRSHTNRALANLPALELEDPLHRVFVEAEQPRDRAIAK